MMRPSQRRQSFGRNACQFSATCVKVSGDGSCRPYCWATNSAARWSTVGAASGTALPNAAACSSGVWLAGQRMCSRAAHTPNRSNNRVSTSESRKKARWRRRSSKMPAAASASNTVRPANQPQLRPSQAVKAAGVGSGGKLPG